MTRDWETMPVGTADTLRECRLIVANLPHGEELLLAKIDAILAQLTPAERKAA